MNINMPKISRYNTFYFLRYAHVRCVEGLFTNIQKQQNMLQISLLFQNLPNSRINNSRILRIRNAKFAGYCFYMNTNIQEDFRICISVPSCFKSSAFDSHQALLTRQFLRNCSHDGRIFANKSTRLLTVEQSERVDRRETKLDRLTVFRGLLQQGGVYCNYIIAKIMFILRFGTYSSFRWIKMEAVFSSS